MAKQTINPQNWCDDSVEIMVNESKKTVRVQGNLLELKFKTLGEHELLEVYYEGHMLCSGGKIGKEYYLTDGDIEREHSDPYHLAVIMACNLI